MTYNPNQPRDPGGPGGGQWVKVGSGSETRSPNAESVRVSIGAEAELLKRLVKNQSLKDKLQGVVWDTGAQGGGGYRTNLVVELTPQEAADLRAAYERAATMDDVKNNVILSGPVDRMLHKKTVGEGLGLADFHTPSGNYDSHRTGNVSSSGSIDMGVRAGELIKSEIKGAAVTQAADIPDGTYELGGYGIVRVQNGLARPVARNPAFEALPQDEKMRLLRSKRR